MAESGFIICSPDKEGNVSLNIANGNMYDFITHTWNTVKGKCPHGCSYCYMHRWGKQTPLHFDEKELKTDLGSGNFIFVGSSCDMFADDIPDDWIKKTLWKCAHNPLNQYLFQTKNPEHVKDFEELFGGLDWIVCTTIETSRWNIDIMGIAPDPFKRARYLHELSGFRKFVTIEPIIDFELDSLIDIIRVCEPEQVNIGADSGNNHLPEPSADKVLSLIEALSKFTEVVQKKNLARLLK